MLIVMLLMNLWIFGFFFCLLGFFFVIICFFFFVVFLCDLERIFLFFNLLNIEMFFGNLFSFMFILEFMFLLVSNLLVVIGFCLCEENCFILFCCLCFLFMMLKIFGILGWLLLLVVYVFGIDDLLIILRIFGSVLILFECLLNMVVLWVIFIDGFIEGSMEIFFMWFEVRCFVKLCWWMMFCIFFGMKDCWLG